MEQQAKETILECRLTTNGYLLSTSEVASDALRTGAVASDCRYHIAYDDNTVELLIAKSETTGIIFPIPVVNEHISKIDESDTVITIHTSAGLLTFTYENGIGSMKLDDVQLHQFQYRTAKEIYFETYPGPYKYVYLTNLDKPYKLNRVYSHIYFDGSIESFSPFKLRYIVNEEHLSTSIKEFDDVLGAMVDKIEDYSSE